MADFEIAIIGAGVVGLAIAARLSERHPNLVLLRRMKGTAWKHPAETAR